MKVLFIILGFATLYAAFWVITTPITVLKLFIDALTDDAEE
jgi:hypothetical protein